MNKLLLIIVMNLFAAGCINSKKGNYNLAEIENLQVENDSLKTILIQKKPTMKKQMMTSLTFQDNNAENAMNFYVELFENSKIINIERWGKEGPGKEGTILQATFDLNGNLFICSDSPPVHNWDFTPAVSIYIECENEGEIDRLYSKLSENGKVAMPMDNYGFSQKFGWVVDKYGVSWQLNLE